MKEQLTQSGKAEKIKTDLIYESLKSYGIISVTSSSVPNLPYLIEGGLYASHFEYLIALIQYGKYKKKHIEKYGDGELGNIQDEIRKVLGNIDEKLLKNKVQDDVEKILGSGGKYKKKKK